MIWIASIGATKIDSGKTIIEAKPAATKNARSKEEAVGICLQMAFDEYPREEGWLNHRTAVFLLPEDWIAEGERTCSVLLYTSLSGGRACGKPAVATLDEGQACAFLVCRQCASFCDSGRLTEIEK